MDDDEPDNDNIPNTPENHPGVDDGFFPDIGPRIGDEKPKRTDPPNGNVPSGRRPSVNNFPYAPGYDVSSLSSLWHYRECFVCFQFCLFVLQPFEGNPQIIPDVNVYQHKKTLGEFHY